MKHPISPTPADPVTTMFALGCLIRAHDLPYPINITLYGDTVSVLVRPENWTVWVETIAPAANPTLDIGHEVRFLRVTGVVYGVSIHLDTNGLESEIAPLVATAVSA